MKKKILSLLLAVVMLVSVLPMSAITALATTYYENITYHTIERGDILVKGYGLKAQSSKGNKPMHVYVDGSYREKTSGGSYWYASACVQCTDWKTNNNDEYVYFSTVCNSDKQGSKASDATCSSPASYYYYCSYCNSYKTTKSVGSSLGHNYSQQGSLYSNATCTSPAYYYKKCSRCTSQSGTMAVGSALGHSYTKPGSLVSSATCTSPAVYIAQCERCTATSGTIEVGDPLGHDWVAGATLDDPVLCSVCGKDRDAVTLTFKYAADCQRSPAYPRKGASFTASGFSNPLTGYQSFGSTMSGDWGLTSKGKYSGDLNDYPGHYSSALSGIVSSLARQYDVDVSDIDVFELTDGDKHIAYGVLCATLEDGSGLFIGDTWGGGGGYILSNNDLTKISSLSGIIEKDLTTGYKPSASESGADGVIDYVDPSNGKKVEVNLYNGDIQKIFNTNMQRTNQLFTGWYTDKGVALPKNTNRFDQFTTLSAGFTAITPMAKDPTDEKMVDDYLSFELVGAQIRQENTIEDDSSSTTDKEVYGGLRYISSFEEDLYNTIGKSNVIEYGILLASKDNAKLFADHYGVSYDKYEIQYNNGVNGGTADTDFRYVTNVVCSGLEDHRTFDNYRLFTAVIDYEGAESLKGTEFVARSYIKYRDANGVERIFYGDYRGTKVFGGCSISYDRALAM